MKKIKVHKAPGTDGLPAEVYKHDGDQLLEKLTSLFTLYWEKGDSVPVEAKGRKVGLFKLQRSHLALHRGQNPSPCFTWQTRPSCGRRAPPGFRANGGTTDTIFILRQVQEKCREQEYGPLCSLH